MNRLLTILLLAAGTAYGQINNPPTSVNIVDSTATGRAVLTATNAAAAATAVGLGAANNVTFSNITANGIVTANDSTATPATNAAAAQGIQWPGLGGSQHAAIYGGYAGAAQIALAVGTSNSLSDVATFSATGMTVNSNAIVGGTLGVTGNATFSGTANLAPSQTADSGSSLMTRDLLYPAQTDDASGDLVFPGSFVSSGTGASASAYFTAGNLAAITTNTNTMAGAYFGESIWTHNAFSGGNMPSDKVLDLALKGVMLRMETNQNYVLRVVMGAGGPTRTPPPAGSDALTARGWGVNFFYNGTNYVYQPFWYAANYNTGPAVALTNLSTAYSQWTTSVFTMRLRQETNGDIKFWVNNGLNSRLGSTPSFQTNVVWGASTFGGRSIAIEAAAATNAAPVSAVRIHNRVGYLKYEQ